MFGKKESPESVECIKAVTNELERCHVLFNRQSLHDLDQEKLLKRMREMQELLMTLAKRHNGLEY